MEDDSAGGDAVAAVCGVDYEGAGPGNGDGVHGRDGDDAVPGGCKDTVLRGGRCAGVAGAVLHVVSCEVQARQDAGVCESGGGPARDGVPYSAIADCGGNGRISWIGI